ncbi:MAG: MFS transporter [Chloroflexi bacterium]|nr:MFS transporter [Chloroflexota bacterium]
MTKSQSALVKRQNLLVGALCTTYGLLYLGRVNISVVLPLLAIELDVSRAQVGILGTVFFWTYGIGNFVNGEIGSHVRPYRVIGVGLLVTAIVNLVFGFQTSLLLMLVLWGINGLAQSGGWPPIVRILAERLDPSRIKQVSTVIPVSYVIGIVVTWTFVGAVAAGENWRLAFWLPGLILLLTAGLWWKGGIDAPTTDSKGVRLSTIMAEARGVAFALAVSALAGFVRNGSIIWLPSYILDGQLISDDLVGAVAALTQVVAIPGLMLARLRVVRTNQVLVTGAYMFSAGGLAFVLLSATSGISAIVVLCLAMMILGGAFGLVTSSMPVILSPPGRTSSIAGTLNMMATFAGGVAGFGIGAIVEHSGWNAVFGVWGIMLLLAAAITWRHRHEEDRWSGADEAG